MSQRFFITGTDTGIGKTYFACKYLEHLKQRGLKTIALKPVASGCAQTEEGLRNEDALLLQHAASMYLPYEKINPFAFEPAIAPHIGAALAGVNLSAAEIAAVCQNTFKHPADVYIIEGAGGWKVPLNRQETWADFVKVINAKVILVVGMRLGCLNHALLSAEAIQNSGCELAGWVANCLEPDMPYLPENIATLKAQINAPLLFRERGFTGGISLDFP